jgi:NAD(P)-dependent dehydrogenase (short-subunit alcohol dehydrogenase family)
LSVALSNSIEIERAFMPFEDSRTTRRKVVGGVATGVAAAIAARVNAVAPGPVWTPLQVVGGQEPDKLPEFGANTPMGRPGQPVELAPLYVLLASSEPTDSTGQVFGAVGGRG